MNKKPKILIIEDNRDLVEMYTLKFTKEGFTMIAAYDGEEGLLKAIEEKPDLILLDILMPNMDGWQVLKAIRNNTSLDCKIIILSNLGQQEQVDQAYQMGASAYLVKANFTPSEVVAKVREFLDENVEESYHLKLASDHYDYEKFMQTTPDPAKAATCPNCYGDVILEFTPNVGRTEGKWWHAHFICSKCGQSF